MFISPFCSSFEPLIIQTEAFCQVKKHYGSHGRSMKKCRQCLGSQIAIPTEAQRCKFMQWPNPLQQPSVF